MFNQHFSCVSKESAFSRSQPSPFRLPLHSGITGRNGRIKCLNDVSVRAFWKNLLNGTEISATLLWAGREEKQSETLWWDDVVMVFFLCSCSMCLMMQTGQIYVWQDERKHIHHARLRGGCGGKKAVMFMIYLWGLERKKHLGGRCFRRKHILLMGALDKYNWKDTSSLRAKSFKLSLTFQFEFTVNYWQLTERTYP